ncbi:related to Cytochrome B translational activator protein CBS2 [Zygosaccharomyces bailii]|nr:related to Cytochrome B translational activator protein CBS2 [Zygosaccharomyces bailii]
MAIVPRVYSFVNTPISSLLAYDIAQLPIQPKIPQVVLLLNDRKKLDRFLDNDSKLVLQNRDGHDIHQTQFMASYRPPVYSTGELAVMENVMISGRNSRSLSFCLQKLKNSLIPSSNVLLLNPPIGSIEYLYRKLWPEGSTPNLFIGITPVPDSFYAFEPEEFHYRLKRNSMSLKISSVPKVVSAYEPENSMEEMKNLKDNALMNLVQDAAQNKNGGLILDLMFYSYGELLLTRLERLIIVSCIRPLAFLNQCKSKGELLKSNKALHVIYKLIREQVTILTSSHPFLMKLPNHSIALDPDRLYEQTIEYLKKSRKSYSSTIECPDVDELTGYFVRLARNQRLNCRWNETISLLVQGKTELERHRKLDYFHMI